MGVFKKIAERIQSRFPFFNLFKNFKHYKFCICVKKLENAVCFNNYIDQLILVQKMRKLITITKKVLGKRCNLLTVS